MYYKDDDNQLGIDEFFLPFGGKLSRDNRWVQMSEMIPWPLVEEVYMKNMSQETGRSAISARIAFGAIYINEHEKLTDERTVTAIAENPYMQYFLGLKEFTDKPLFDPSMMVHFRKRFPAEELVRINEAICAGGVTADKDSNDNDNPPPPAKSGSAGKLNKNTSKKKLKKQKKYQKENRGKLLMDATVAPADIKYPTDIDLLNKSREHLEKAIDILWHELAHKGHKLPYSAKKARKSYLALAKSKRWTAAKVKKAIGEQLRYIEEATARLMEYEGCVPYYDDLYPYWLKDRLNVIPLVYAQQKEMYENGTHTCENRIVSLQQPHVRPIKRGKKPNETEFGQKLHLSVVDGYTYIERTSWNNFNEGTELIAVAEEYRRKFGCYPEAILADKIYQTRQNRSWCKANGIRLSGPPLGRRKASETDAKVKNQMYRDACERNAIEGRNGNAKRRWGLDRIMSKLNETAKTEAALAIIAMNVSHRLALWLCRLFGLRWRWRVFQ